MLAAYWSLLRSGLPREWLQDERREFIAKLEALRDAEGAAMVEAEQSGDMAEFTNRREKYEALASVVPEPPTAAPAGREEA